MKNNTILIHVKNNEMLTKYIKLLNNNWESEETVYSQEIEALIKEFMDNNWTVYLTSIENFDFKGKWTLYCINEKCKKEIDLEEINKKISFMIIRNLGSVEANINTINKYLDFLINNYKGKIINNPKAMKIGMTKNYLTQIEPEILRKIGILTIPTKIYDNKLTFKKIKEDYKVLKEYIIKPSTGELSNSLKNLGEIDEEFLRYKEDKVGGWVIQPVQKEIWNRGIPNVICWE